MNGVKNWGFKPSTHHLIIHKLTAKSLLEILKKKLTEKKGEWEVELLRVLWAYRTTIKTLMGETPFALAFGSEAIALVEIGMSTHRVRNFNQMEKDEALEEHLDLLEERREEVEV